MCMQSELRSKLEWDIHLCSFERQYLRHCSEWEFFSLLVLSEIPFQEIWRVHYSSLWKTFEWASLERISLTLTLARWMRSDRCFDDKDRRSGSGNARFATNTSRFVLIIHIKCDSDRAVEEAIVDFIDAVTEADVRAQSRINCGRKYSPLRIRRTADLSRYL